MTSSAHGYTIFLNGVIDEIGPADGREWTLAESLVRAEYERCNPGDRFDDLKKRARFSKEDQGLLRDWMALAVQRAAERNRPGKDLTGQTGNGQAESGTASPHRKGRAEARDVRWTSANESSTVHHIIL